jgi:hypothetical protein
MNFVILRCHPERSEGSHSWTPITEFILCDAITEWEIFRIRSG